MSQGPANPFGVDTTDGTKQPKGGRGVRGWLSGIYQALFGAPDVFGNLIIGSRNNQIEVHFDDPSYTTYITNTLAGGGLATQTQGQLIYSTSTGATGRASGVTVDSTTYRPLHEIYWGWTAAWLSGGAANSFQRIGAGDSAFVNGVQSTFEGTSFGLIYWRNSVSTFVAQASWNGDPCDGSATSGYTLNGLPVAMDTTKKQIFVAKAGLLGSLTLEVWVYTPDQKPLKVHTFSRPNNTSDAIFTNFDLPMLVDLTKTSGATNLQVATACWAGGTTTLMQRMTDTLTDRSLAQTVRAVIWGKSTAGGSAYVAVKVTPSGAVVTADGADKTEDSGHVSGDTGAFVLGVRNDANAALTTTDLDYSPIATDSAGRVKIAGSLTPSGTQDVAPTAGTTGGATPFRNAALTNTAVAVKASAGKVWWYNLFNPGVALAYVHFYDVAAASVTVGTTTPTLSIALPSTATASVGDDTAQGVGIQFSTAIAMAASTTPGGGTAPGTALVVNVGYA